MNLEDKFCSKPFEHFEIQPSGKVSLCCHNWLPHYAGQINGKHSIDDVFNSDKVQKIRKSILDGSFKFCNHKLCPHIQNGSLPDKQDIHDPRTRQIIDENKVTGIEPKFYNLCYDESCNLSCPSCRTDKINHNSGPAYEHRKKLQSKVIEKLFSEPHDNSCIVNITGSGDPFGSKIFRELLFNIDGSKFPNVLINLQTNGVMFTPRYWDKIERIQDNINTVIVSYDASLPETYKVTRRGGNWDTLQQNMAFISQLRKHKKINELRIDFVVQQANYTEMPLFVQIGKELEVDTVYFSCIVNWGTWTDEEFANQAVWQSDHPEINKFKVVLSDPIFDDPIVDLGNITRFKIHGKEI